MSSLHNAVKAQKTHRERHQPDARKNLGLLEKKKDYKQRARDFNKKKATIKKLRKKALIRNPDEFYFHMINSKVEDGVHKEKSKAEKFTDEQLALMQTQDLKYIITKRTSERSKIEKLRARLHLISATDKPKNVHTIFVDNDREKEDLNLAARLGTHEAFLGRSFNRPLMEDLKKGKFSTYNIDPEQVSEANKATRKGYKELEQRIAREEQLAVLQAKMEIKVLLKSGKNKPERIVQEETKSSAPVYVWPKRERSNLLCQNDKFLCFFSLIE
uniref:U3 small nucleolar RNA-associated protein 11 n=1 Tax=Pseudodiaptomus poplesia TaxID=213370 RepID=A0A1S6GL58_9MAXI|nr:putative u3 small nucleolar RNA-associated protein 11 [Pseudodiaptomus poplesia]